MGVWLAAASVLSWRLWRCEAGAGGRWPVLSPAERWHLDGCAGLAAPAGGRVRRSRAGTMEGSACRGEASRHCVRRGRGEGQHAALRPRGHGGFGPLRLTCALLSALLCLHPVFCGMKCLAFCALLLCCPLATQVSSVFVGRGGEQKGKRRRVW